MNVFEDITDLAVDTDITVAALPGSGGACL